MTRRGAGSSGSFVALAYSSKRRENILFEFAIDVLRGDMLVCRSGVMYYVAGGMSICGGVYEFGYGCREVAGECVDAVVSFFRLSVCDWYSFLSFERFILNRICECCSYFPLSHLRVFSIKVCEDFKTFVDLRIDKLLFFFCLVSITVGSNLEGCVVSISVAQRRVLQQASASCLVQVVTVDVPSNCLLYNGSRKNVNKSLLTLVA